MDTVNIDAVPMVAVRVQSRRDDLSVNIPKALDPVWKFLRTRSDLKPGLNVAVYLEGPKTMEVGVQVAGPFDAPEGLVYTQSPAGFAAHGIHMGPYSELGKTYEALHAWIACNNFRMMGPFWEVYGHWNDDPQKLRTDIYYLVEKKK